MNVSKCSFMVTVGMRIKGLNSDESGVEKYLPFESHQVYKMSSTVSASFSR